LRNAKKNYLAASFARGGAKSVGDGQRLIWSAKWPAHRNPKATTFCVSHGRVFSEPYGQFWFEHHERMQVSSVLR
jgi:hypothetical protein